MECHVIADAEEAYKGSQAPPRGGVKPEKGRGAWGPMPGCMGMGIMPPGGKPMGKPGPGM